ncbi:acyl-CoA dehydrogenase family protein [Azospirillum rugosum]|uniref:Alkylation response protein AidB-like acyl-CoA dehydrogenase n=1 Tax=Azospirillum rugosum TaxID=416170 RepID=A0ABS4SWA2_9PROT|nr:acyl-CoA dehydrogenase family protein [Azospirillum rugosum]MBP2296846.1 alkylation response protein AidB-like acyl-CoA dehydrogenase [Azospirillum rugosum]MDQ0530570.1 alkylation response protein AidB-like acyl-CoA dehydrogenase [Azospirillum rugosum]
MDITYTAEERAFRDEVRRFLHDRLPADIAAKVREGKRVTREDHVRWQSILAEQGWFAVHWPKQYGGTGWTPIQRHIFDEEYASAHAPYLVPFGVSMVGPVIIKFGTEEQKRRYLPRILSQEDWWCQGYSEPGAGSDLASVKTRAVRDGDHYVVNGQKTWTTLGQYANMMFCLARTDPTAKQQEGISFLLIDMDTPGVTVRPIITLDGAHEVNEVFLDDVRVPVEDRVGEEGKGWTCAKFLLTYERTGIAGVGHAKQALAHLKDVARHQTANGRPLYEDPLFRARIAEVEVDLMALEMTNLRVISAAQNGGVPGAESSMLKVRGTEIRQAITDLLRRAVGPYALPFLPEALEGGWDGEPVGPDYAAPLSAQYFNRRKLSIYGGSNEIQKNIIAKMILGL